MKTSILSLTALWLMTLAGCVKQPQENLQFPGQKALVREIQWNATSKALITYYPDSTIKQMEYQGQASAYMIQFIHQQKLLREINVGPNIYRFEYSYDAQKRISRIRKKDLQANRYSQDFEFTYQATGKLSRMSYREVNEGGMSAPYVADYQYNSQNQLTEIACLDRSGNKTWVNIDALGPDIGVDPLLFIAYNLSEDFMVYNIPCLLTLKKLPSQLTFKALRGGKIITERTVKTDFVVQNGKLEEELIEVKFPEYPQYNTNSSTKFLY